MVVDLRLVLEPLPAGRLVQQVLDIECQGARLMSGAYLQQVFREGRAPLLPFHGLRLLVVVLLFFVFLRVVLRFA